jgi:adenylate cyclase
MSEGNTSPLFDWIEKNAVEGVLTEEAVKEAYKKFGTTKAILVADSSGFTRLTRSQGILAFLALVNMMRQRVIPIFKKYGGTEIRAEADNLYALFDTIDDAVEASIEAHLALKAHNDSVHESHRFNICIGIGYGDVLDGGHEGVYGDQMNIASKLGEDTAEADELLVSDKAFHTLKNPDKYKSKLCTIEVSGVNLEYYLIEYGNQ